MRYVRNLAKRIGNPKRKYILFVVFYGIYNVAIFFIYFKLWRSYFTQDEWYYFGLFNLYTDDQWGFLHVFIEQFTKPELYGIHFTPLYNSLFFLEYQFFRLNFAYYALASMFLHGITSLLTSVLGFRLTKSWFVAFVAGLYFAIGYMQYEGVTWANTHLQVQIPSILIIISLLLYVKGLQRNRSRLLFTSLGLFTIGVLVKENIVGMLLVYFVFSNLYKKSKLYLLSLRSLLLLFLLYIPFRFLLPLVLANSDEKTSSLPYGILEIGPHLFRMVFYPFKAILQQYITPDVIVRVAETITYWNYPLYTIDADGRGKVFLDFINSAGADFVMLLMTIPLCLGLYILFTLLRKHSPNLVNAYFVSLVFIFGSVLPLIFLIPWLLTLFDYATFLASRYFYLITIGTSLLLAVTFQMFLTLSFKRKISNKYIRTMTRIIVIFIILLFFTREVIISKINAQQVIGLGEERNMIVNYIQAVHPNIHDRSVFYITSDTQYFGFASYTVPFQTNFGYTLLNVYQPLKRYDLSFFLPGQLAGQAVDTQGYREVEGKGLGYFIDGLKLLEGIKKHSIPTENIYSFHYNGYHKILAVTTEKIRKHVQKEQLYESQTQKWSRYYDTRNMIGTLYAENSRVYNRETEKIKILSVLEDSSVVYDIILYKDTAGDHLDSFVKKTLGDGALIKKGDVHLRNLITREAVIAERDNTHHLFFQHPRTFQIIELRYVNPLRLDKSTEVLLWSLLFG